MRYIVLMSLLAANLLFADKGKLKLPPKVKILDQISTNVAKSSSGTGELSWTDQMVPQLNFLKLNGYFRTRGHYLYRCSLGTSYNTGEKTVANESIFSGTSGCPDPLSYRQALDDTSGSVDPEALDKLPHSLFTMDMRFRLDPTLNVSEDIRIKGTVDFFDNLVFGSTPDSMTKFGENPSVPHAFFSNSQNPPMVGINSPYGSINLKRVWGEASLPFGELRFGRMPLNFGLGVLFNSGSNLDDDLGDSIDGILFATKLFGVYFIPGYSISFSGPVGRGGGFGAQGDKTFLYYPGERGQRFNLDVSDDVHNFYLTIAQMDSETKITQELAAGNLVYNFGLLALFRMQDNITTLFSGLGATGNANRPENYNALWARSVPLNAKLGALSFWSAFYWDKLEVQLELVGSLGQIAEFSALDSSLKDPLWIFNGGFALQSQYGFMDNKLRIGLDAGWASGDSAPGFGNRWGINKTPTAGAADGQQFGASDNYLTNFKFNPSYHVDLILFREILGTVTDAFYFRPHITYEPFEGLGIRGDIISSFAQFASSTPGQAMPLGLEFDVTGYYQTEDGFNVQLQYGFLLPFAGLNHNPSMKASDQTLYSQFGEAKSAQTLKVLLGIVF